MQYYVSSSVTERDLWGGVDAGKTHTSGVLLPERFLRGLLANRLRQLAVDGPPPPYFQSVNTVPLRKGREVVHRTSLSVAHAHLMLHFLFFFRGEGGRGLLCVQHMHSMYRRPVCLLQRLAWYLPLPRRSHKCAAHSSGIQLQVALLQLKVAVKAACDMSRGRHMRQRRHWSNVQWTLMLMGIGFWTAIHCGLQMPLAHPQGGLLFCLQCSFPYVVRERLFTCQPWMSAPCLLCATHPREPRPAVSHLQWR